MNNSRYTSHTPRHPARRSDRRFALRQIWPWLAIAGALLVALAWAAWGANRGGPTGQPVGDSGPRIAFEETFYDFGDVPLDEYVEHDFVYRNVGDQPLVIQEEPKIELVEGC
ncbi:MAG: DUF1573 domain-containing protein [Chloroflexi bacterium]|nr:DUF1573 domain-containing protein [Chloroflexota bacterium]